MNIPACSGVLSHVGVSLLAIAVRQSHQCRMLCSHREQARSHIYGYPLFCNTVFDAVFGLLSSIRRLSGVVAPRLDENRCPTILISGTAFQPCGSSGLSSGRLAVHVISYPASQNQVGGARVTAGSGVHRGWPRIEFSVMGRNCPGDSCQLVGQRADHEIGVMAGR